MSGRRLLEDAMKIAAVAMICAPMLPDARVCWWMAMRGAQNVSRHFGLLAIAAEKQYRKDVP